MMNRTSWLTAVALVATSLVACSGAKAPTPTAAAPTTTAPAAAAPAKIDDNEPRADSEAAIERLAQMPAQDRLPGGRWQAGKNYTVLVPAQPTNVGPGKVEVIEVFWYGCPHCYDLDPFLETWRKNKPANVEFVRLPVTWSGGHKAHARLFYTLQALKREDLHVKVFDTIHRQRNMLALNDEKASLDMQVAWAKQNGIDGKQFADAWNSMWVSTKVKQADELLRRYQIEGVPHMIVNGKYSFDVGTAGGHTQLLALVNDLAAAEQRR
ncbi:MAG: thiol:disulfide interchange protein DsbA/DsbL [Gammaproteobacteria bacterium]|jgi:thiol:disulfide interchange protein DsbA|nr:thiol:disulfide interchange protein DsbA/DsbL [Gammaproteobacteria bacterium]